MDYTIIVATSVAIGLLGAIVNGYFNKQIHDEIKIFESIVVGIGLGFGSYICIGAFIGVTSM